MHKQGFILDYGGGGGGVDEGSSSIMKEPLWCNGTAFLNGRGIPFLGGFPPFPPCITLSTFRRFYN